jgi:hypothetical protein
LFQWKQEDKEIGKGFYLGVNITKCGLGGAGGNKFLLTVLKKLINIVMRICELSNYL